MSVGASASHADWSAPHASGVVGKQPLAGHPLADVLDLARWAPSGDNSQPWRFELVSDSHVVVHAFDTRRHCVYDLDGRASQLSVGALLETMRIAASARRFEMRTERRIDAPDEHPLIDAWFTPSSISADPLHAAILKRSVQRKPLSSRRLDERARAELERSVGPAYGVIWFESLHDRARMAWLAVRSAKIRLTIPEAYAVHRDIIEWNARFSEERVPDQALGADPMTLQSMKWAMASWSRIETMNRFFGGTVMPRIQLDLLPGLRCAAHFAIVANAAPSGIDAQLAAGAAVQRFWLTATSLGLQLQPQYTPIVFAGYARAGKRFTQVAPAIQRAGEVARSLERLLGGRSDRAIFLGRVGHGPVAVARSLRLPLERLLWQGNG